MGKGEAPTGGPLGGAPQRPDERDYILSAVAEMPPAAPRGERRWHYDGMPVLDQQKEGACVGFAWTHFLNCAPLRRRHTSRFAFSLYHAITERDEFPGDWRSGQQGTSVRSGAKEVHRRERLMDGYAFTTQVDEMAAWLYSRGPMVVGVPWFRSMDAPRPDDSYFCRVDSGTGVRGWHAVCLDGVHVGMGDEDFFAFQNSWGPSWGWRGRGRISLAGMRVLMSYTGAAACTAIERRKGG